MNALKYIVTVLVIVGCGVLAVLVIGWLQRDPTSVVQVTELPIILGADRETNAFEALLQSEPSAPLKEVINFTFADSYKLYSCTNGTTEEVALMLAGRHDGDLTTSGYETINSAVRTWEPLAFNEFGHILLPDIDTASYQQQLSFEDVPVLSGSFITEVRRAKVQLGVKEAYVYYGWLMNYIILTTSETCMYQIANKVYHAD